MSDALYHMEPDAQTLLEALASLNIPCQFIGDLCADRFREVRLFSPGKPADRRCLYLVKPEDAAAFTDAGCLCVSSELTANHRQILCPRQDYAILLEALMSIFQNYREQERRIDELVYQNEDLQTLCEVGAGFLGNPVCVHDDWFVIIARSSEAASLLPPELIPHAIIEDFKHDREYEKTYEYRTAQLWTASPNGFPCIYVNLWEGDVYRGRLLVLKERREFRPSDYRLTEILAQRALLMMNRGSARDHRSMDDIVDDLLNGRATAPHESELLLKSLSWSPEDPVMCVCMRDQRSEQNMLMSHALHSDLFRAFPGAYILLKGQKQIMLLNLRRDGYSVSALRYRLAPLCRDYCLYVGLSFPVYALQDWPVTRMQADQALNRAFILRSERWIVTFSECVLDMFADNLPLPMRPEHIISPELRCLMDYDQRNDTRYYETLRAYLLSERSIPRTSEELIIHRTTLLYRLKKISELVKLDLNDPWKRLYLLYSIRLIDAESHRLPVSRN